jgi:hypothetical protein
MKSINTYYKDKIARGLGGACIVVLLVIQQLGSIDLTYTIFLMGLHLCQYGLTGWCPFCNYFQKIGWLKNYHLIVERTTDETRSN